MEVPDIQVIRHWIAWGPSSDCPDSFIEHDAERIELFETWVADVKAQAWEEGRYTQYREYPRPARRDNPYRQGEEQ